MAAIKPRERRETYFFPAAPNRAATGTNASKSRSFPEENGEQKPTIEIIRRKPDLVRPGKRTFSFNIPIFYEDLWADYEKGTATESLINSVSHYSHPTFLRLLCCYHYDQSTFFVWEPVELSLAQVIGSKYPIREAELTSIVWPVSYEFRFLPLEYERRAHIHTPDHPGYSFWECEDWSVLLRLLMLGLTDCVINTEDMNAATLKLFALSDIITGLRKQMSPIDPWSPRAQNLPARLMSTPLDDLLGDDIVAESKGGELKMLVNILSKISHYDVKFP
ncbi:hypothetical protein N7509_000092 [Penicillium cosmopolitanum]|uniref:Uncharacterized protein n=1 Tax=Penicillium cosmopolitanum TaxID=1131564 RepID=A0A9X0BFC6_9EURO|nr:uncharacterized protein N7509_000092 [Penicillium cosmopolitanum]KAJ5414994.1 hypothetical protein N7509_000092 [Penicillium cosmopolitanum]